MRSVRRGDRGSIGLELALITPVLFVLTGFVIGIGRIAEADSRVEAAARDAARAASLADPSNYEKAAEVAGGATLLIDGLSCRDSGVRVTSYQDDGPGPGVDRVTVVVRCTASLGDIAVPGLPGSTVLEASFSAPLDPYRSR